jgi:hypothetical protein
LFGCHIILGRDLEASAFVSLFGVVYYQYVEDEACAVCFFPAEHKAAAFIGECADCILYH